MPITSQEDWDIAADKKLRAFLARHYRQKAKHCFKLPCPTGHEAETVMARPKQIRPRARTEKGKNETAAMAARRSTTDSLDKLCADPYEHGSETFLNEFSMHLTGLGCYNMIECPHELYHLILQKLRSIFPRPFITKLQKHINELATTILEEGGLQKIDTRHVSAEMGILSFPLSAVVFPSITAALPNAPPSGQIIPYAALVSPPPPAVQSPGGLSLGADSILGLYGPPSAPLAAAPSLQASAVPSPASATAAAPQPANVPSDGIVPLARVGAELLEELVGLAWNAPVLRIWNGCSPLSIRMISPTVAGWPRF